MSIANQMKEMQGPLNKWAETKGGRCIVVGDKSHLWNELMQKPGAPRVLLMFVSEKPRGFDGRTAENSRVDRTYLAIITRNRGMLREPGDSLTKGSGGGEPMFDLAEQMRNEILCFELDPLTTERPIDYRGIEPFLTDENIRGDAYQVEFSIGTQLEPTVAVPDQQFPT